MCSDKTEGIHNIRMWNDFRKPVTQVFHFFRIVRGPAKHPDGFYIGTNSDTIRFPCQALTLPNSMSMPRFSQLIPCRIFDILHHLDKWCQFENTNSVVSQGEANEKLEDFVMQQHILIHSSQTCFSKKANYTKLACVH
jgi:hypothetical protein